MAKTGKGSSKGASSIDAITLLITDHQEVKELFERYKELAASDAEDDAKRDLAEQICNMLTIHAAIEEELFYPAAWDALDDVLLLNEAAVEHQSAKDLIAQIQASDPTDALYDAQVNVLGEYVNHHVQEEEGELFPKVQESDLDLEELGAEMSARQEELLSAEADIKDV